MGISDTLPENHGLRIGYAGSRTLLRNWSPTTHSVVPITATTGVSRGAGTISRTFAQALAVRNCSAAASESTKARRSLPFF
jgi:hypothetical protein